MASTRRNRRSGYVSRTKRAVTGALTAAVDGAVGIVSPRRAIQRKTMRNMSQFLDRRHDARMARLESGESLSGWGASSSGGGGFRSAERSRDSHSWLTSLLSPDAALEHDLEEMRSRANSAYKNYELARAHVERRVQRVIGCGITMRPAVRVVEGLINDAQAKALNRQISDSLERTLPRLGHHGEPFHVIQRMVERHWEKDGEAFVLFGDKADRMSPVTLKLEVIHPRRVETPPSQRANPLVRMGIVYNRRGDKAGFYVRSKHPGDNKEFEVKHDFIPATYKNGLPRMLHLYDKLEAGQSRGYPHLQVSLSRFKNTEEYEDADLERNIIAGSHAAFVTTEADPSQLAELYGTDVKDVTGQRYEDIEPGMIKYLSPLEKIDFNSPPGPQAAFVPYIEHQGRMAAAGVGSSYEMMSGNWKGLSYSAAKAIWNDEQIPIDCRRKDISMMLLVPTYQHIVTRLVIGDGLVGVDAVQYRSEPWHYWRMRSIAPKRYSLDPQREGASDERDVANGFAVAADVVEQRTGEPAEDVYEAMEQDIKAREDKGIINPQPKGGGTELGDDNPESSEANQGKSPQKELEPA